MAEMYYYNGVLLPEIPADVLAENPYVWMKYSASSGNHMFFASPAPWQITFGGRFKSSASILFAYKNVPGSDTWQFAYEGDTGEFDAVGFIWTSHDTAQKDNPALISYPAMKAYRAVDVFTPDTAAISKERMIGIADQARRLGNVKGELTPEQIQDALEGSLKGYANGTKWENSNLKETKAYFFIKANGLWVFGSNDDTGIYYSADGKTWVQSNITAGNIWKAAYGNGMWICGGSGTGIYYSADGKTWTKSSITTGNVNSCCYYDGRFVACVGHYIHYSADGKTWTNTNTRGTSLAHGGGILMCCSGSYGLRYSRDGISWTLTNITGGNAVCAAVYADGIWVGYSTGYNGLGIYYSVNGKTWTLSNITNNGCNSIAYGNGVWAAAMCNYNSSGAGSHAGIYYSTDGKTWSQSNITKNVGTEIRYADGIWLCVTNSSAESLLYSIDGKTWNPVANNPKLANGHIANHDGMWVGCASSNKGIKYSAVWEPTA